MTAVLDVLPDAYRASARRVGDDVSALVRLGAAQLVRSLEGTGGMAGSDDCGREWGASYDDAARSAFGALTDVHNGLQTVGELLDQTACNYAAAESSSAGSVIVGREFYATLTGSLGSVPSSVGAGVASPNGWGLAEAFIHRAWPNGHQDRLHTAGSAWQRTCNELLDLTSDMGRAVIPLMEQRAPEVADAVVVVNDLSDQIIAVADECWAIGVACHEYAHHLDEAHHRIIEVLEQLLHDTAETVVVGTLFAIVTAGAGAIAAGVSEAAAVRSAGAAIAAVIDVLLAAATSVAGEADLVAARFAQVSDAVRPVLARKAEQAELVQAHIRGDGLIVGRVLPAADSAVYAVGSTTVPAKALARLEAEAAEAAVRQANLRLIEDPKSFDPLQLRGMSTQELELSIPGSWQRINSARGGGTVFKDPIHAGRQVRTMPGYGAGSRPEPVTQGPYVVVSQNGKYMKVALAGNPTLK